MGREMVRPCSLYRPPATRTVSPAWAAAIPAAIVVQRSAGPTRTVVASARVASAMIRMVAAVIFMTMFAPGSGSQRLPHMLLDGFPVPDVAAVRAVDGVGIARRRERDHGGTQLAGDMGAHQKHRVRCTH